MIMKHASAHGAMRRNPRAREKTPVGVSQCSLCTREFAVRPSAHYDEVHGGVGLPCCPPTKVRFGRVCFS